MTFYVNGIKQEKDTEYKVEMLVESDDGGFVRKLLEDFNILILSLKEFTGDKKSFGEIFLTIAYAAQEIHIFTTYIDPQEAAMFFSFVGFDIQKIDSVSTPIIAQKSKEIIASTKAEAQKKKDELYKHIEEEEEAERKIYEDPKLESAKKIVLEVFEKVDQSLKRADATIELLQMKEIKRLTEELKKLRMGTNFEKIRDTIKELFGVVDTVDDAYFASIQNIHNTIAPDSLVTMTDVDREFEKMEKIKILKKLHTHISLNNQDYASFGAGAIYRKFLQKDLLMKFGNLPALLYSFYDIVELVLLVALSLLGVYTLANQIYLFSFNHFGLSYMLMNLGLRGMVIFAARYFRNRNIGRLLLIIAIAILLHYLLMRAVTTNFAL